jgi:phosphoglycerate dehydrogenase-like enzyme
MGILGMGGIGHRFAEMVHSALGMKTFYHSRTKKDSAPQWAEYVADLEEFLGKVDVVSVHIALKEETVGFVGEKELRAMKRGSILINTARGKVVDEEALIKVLEEGHVS